MTGRPTAEELERRYVTWPTEDLVRAVSSEADGYTPTAVSVMKQVLRDRGVSETDFASIGGDLPQDGAPSGLAKAGASGRRAVALGGAASKRRWSIGGVLEGLDFLELLIYGGLAAAIVLFSLWVVVQAIWAAGSPWVRASLLTVVGLGAAVIVNDVQRRRFSLLSGLLVTVWGIVVMLLVVASF